MFLIDGIILVSGVLLLLGIVSSKVSSRLGIPVLVLFLVLGMLAGSDGPGGIEFENYPLAHGIGTLALTMILFDGGLSTSIASIKTAWKPSIVLATWGVLVTATITGLAGAWILDVSLLQGLLLGSIVGSTDASAVFSVLRSGGISLSKRITAVLEVESASNDPMAIFLTIGCIELLLGRVQFGPSLLWLFGSQMVIGAICGGIGGYCAGWAVNRIELSVAGMYPVLVSSFCLLTYGLAAELGGSGFLAVYLAGLIIGNRPLVFQRGIRQYHDAVAWLSQIVMFVVLGLLSFPSRLVEVAGKAILVSVVLIFVARPIAVLLSVPFRFNRRELTFISWVGLKGAVPITLATFPLMLSAGDKALESILLFDVVFFVVVLSAIVQGMTLTPVARWLGLERPRQPEPPVALEISSLRHVKGQVVDYAVRDDSRAVDRLVKDLALPEGAVIALISRGEEVIPPQGATRILAGDHVILVLRPGIEKLVDRVFARTSEAGEAISPALEFPLRASTTIGDLQENYTLNVNGSRDRTIADLMREQLGDAEPNIGDAVQLGELCFRVLRLDDQGRIELVGMTIRSESQPGE